MMSEDDMKTNWCNDCGVTTVETEVYVWENGDPVCIPCAEARYEEEGC